MIRAIHLDPPWLEVTLDQPARACSWAIVGGGCSSIEQVVWRQVHNTDLPPDRDPVAWLQDQVAMRGYSKSLAFLTSHPLRHYVVTGEAQDGLRVDCVATVALGNGRRIGDPPGPGRVGTINILSTVSVPLSQGATLEAMALVAEARTAACLAFAYPSPVSQLPVTGSGTDCIAVVSPMGEEGEAYAGKHTLLGHLIGKTVYEAVTSGVESWARERSGA